MIYVWQLSLANWWIKPIKVTENYLLQSGEFKSNNIYGKPTCRG